MKKDNDYSCCLFLSNLTSIYEANAHISNTHMPTGISI